MLAEKLNSLLDPFKTRYPSLIGIDLSSTALKLVELSETGKGTYRLERYAIEPLVRSLLGIGAQQTSFVQVRNFGEPLDTQGIYQAHTIY